MKQISFLRWVLIALLGLLLGATGCSKQAKAGRHLNRANSFFAADQYDKAEIEYLNVLKIVRTNAVALRNLGEIYYADEQFMRAAALFKAAREVNPDDLESRAKLSRLFLLGGAPKEARQEAEFVIQKAPANEDAILTLVDGAAKPEDIKLLRQRLGALRQQAGEKPIFHIAEGFLALRERNARNAEAEFKAAAAGDPKSATAQWGLAQAYMAQTNSALAEPAFKAAADLSPIRSARRLRVAAMRLQAKDVDGAKAALAEMTAKAPDYLPAWVYAARLAFDQKQLDECAADLERVLSRMPDHYEALSMRAELYLAQNQPEKALADLEQLTTRFPRNANARYQMALAAVMAKDTGRALASLNQAVALDKNLTPAVLLLSELNVRKGDAGPAIALLTDLLKREPTNKPAHSLLASAYQASGKPDQALQVYERMSKVFPNDHESRLMRGVVLRQQGKLAEARQVFESILTSSPNDVPANAQIIDMDLTARAFEPAIARIQKWMARSPNDAEPIFQMARLRFAQEDYKAAQPLLEKVIAMNKDAIPAYQMLARIYYKTQQVDSAIEKSRLALTRNPRDTSSLLLIAIIYDEKADYARARDEYEKLLAIDPQNLVALNNLAVVYADRFGDFDKAYSFARKAEELHPNNAFIDDTFGWISSRRGDLGVATGLLKQAIAAKPNDPEILSHLGLTRYLAGDEAGARASLEPAIKIAGTFASRPEAETCLAILNINPAAADAKAISALEKRLAEKPADPIALERLAAVYNKAGSADKAVAIYEKALAANPKLALASARLAELNERKLNNPGKALDLAKTARKLSPEDPVIAHIAGRIATTASSDLNDQRWGLGLLQSAAQKIDDPALTYDLGWAYYTQGELADAETSMKAVAAAGGPAAAEARRFLDFMPLSQPALAARQTPLIEQTLERDPKYLPALAARAAAAQSKGDTAAAFKTLDQELALYPGFAPALRAYTLLAASQTGDNPRAFAIAARAQQAFPEDPEISRAAGIISYQHGDYQKALRQLAESATKRPDDATLQFYLGMSHHQLKQNPESRTALKKALALQPNASFAADAQRILAEIK
jgi:tetratricopeptide (TPR) repeat protein